MIGRKKEQQILEQIVTSGRPEFLALYGRRRVGKTFLIKEYFRDRISFYATGVAGGKTREQLKAFNERLLQYSDKYKPIPKNWFEAFGRLKEILESDTVLRDPFSGRRVVFLDELPWMSTPRSDFKSALDFFWNSWGSDQKDFLLIACGSASSWIIENLLNDKGGFHNRVTRHIALQPFTLAECEEFYNINGIPFTRRQAIESYMVFGGIPYYLNCLDKRMSLAQNIDELCFNDSGQLRHEFEHLYSSLFKNSDIHYAVIRALFKRSSGLTRKELSEQTKIGGGEPLTKALRELESSGFIRKYNYYGKSTNGSIFQLIDPFTLFHLKFIENKTLSSWLKTINTPSYYSWCGNAFELVALLHVAQIKDALGIRNVESKEYSWRSNTAIPGAQIDLLIDRDDNVINICEIKWSAKEYAIDKKYEETLLNKVTAFQSETNCKKALHLTMITSSGLAHNAYSGNVISEISGDDLFAK